MDRSVGRGGRLVKLNLRTKRFLFYALYALFLVLLVESGARAFWKARGVPFFTAHRKIYRSFYPTVSSLERESLDKDEECFDVLMLGGSVLHTEYGGIEHVLRERLTRTRGQCVRVHNTSAAAHTSLDSYYKYKHLSGKRFDLVMVYHGVNEVRANNCKPSDFQEDYSHLSWYKLINDFEHKADSRWLVFPYTAEFVVLKVAGRLGWSGFLPTHEPEPESLEYGCDVKTKASFRRNLEGILEIASERKEPVLLMSFAFYLPEDYTKEHFENRKLDYTVHTFPVELWGKPECVVAAITAHNEVAAELARQYPEVIFVDQDRLIPKDGRHFNDLCHLTNEGCERFVDNVLDTIPQ